MSLFLDRQKIPVLLAGAASLPPGGELRRRGKILFVDADRPDDAALEAIFASDRESPVELFYFRFPNLAGFVRGEKTVRAVGRNFRGYLLGHFAFLPGAAAIDQAYAAGIDLLDLPPPAGTDARQRDRWLTALAYARTVFPRWGVLATLPVDTEPLPTQRETISLLLDRGVLPFLQLTPAAGRHDEDAIAQLFDDLRQQLQQAGAALKPLLPLLQLTTPLSVPPRRGLAALVDKVQDAHWRTAADLRRLLRVREVEQSFESAGL